MKHNNTPFFSFICEWNIIFKYKSLLSEINFEEEPDNFCAKKKKKNYAKRKLQSCGQEPAALFSIGASS